MLEHVVLDLHEHPSGFFFKKKTPRTILVKSSLMLHKRSQMLWS